MNQVTLNYEQLRAFCGWAESTARKKNPEKKMEHLRSMGMQEITIEGKGKKATFTFTIPNGYWRMALIPSMDYSEVAVDYINTLIEGKDILNTEDGILVLFGTEIYALLAKKHNMNYETVKTTCIRARKHLMEHDYIRNGGARDAKSHRVKRKLEWGWQTGPQAIAYDTKARKVWKDFFDAQDEAYRRINPMAEKAPNWMYASEANELYAQGMARIHLNVDYYKVAKRTIINDNLVADINYMKLAFFESLDMGAVREELVERQEGYKRDKERREQLLKKRIAQEIQQQPPLAERRAIRAKVNGVRQTASFQDRKLSKKAIQERERTLDSIIGYAEENKETSPE